jgi:uncharacterized protein (TIGR03118 family)
VWLLITPFWISSNGQGVATLEKPDGTPQSLVVTIPPSANPPHDTSAPTGQVFNTDTTGFKVTDGTHTASSLFIFASEDGAISGWAPTVGTTTPPSTVAKRMIDNSAAGTVYKGLAIGTLPNGSTDIYATDFHNGKIDVYNDTWGAATLTGSFQDKHIPAGFAPFNIQNIGGNLVVTYAKQDDVAHDDTPGPGNGFVDVFDTNGNLLKRFKHDDALNSPWGVAQAPITWGSLAGDYLIGQFGSGQIALYKSNGHFDGLLNGADGKPVQIDGLWALTFGGGGANNGDKNTLYFTAGPNGESHGLFGSLTIGFKKTDDHHDHDDDGQGADDDGDNFRSMIHHLLY